MAVVKLTDNWGISPTDCGLPGFGWTGGCSKENTIHVEQFNTPEHHLRLLWVIHPSFNNDLLRTEVYLTLI